MVVCSAINCQNATRQGHTLFRFPTAKKDPLGRAMWGRNCGKADLRNEGEYRLCQVHFEANLTVK